MKRIKFIKPQYWLMAFVLTGCLAACTNDDIKIGQVDEGNYTVSNEELAFINDINGKRIFTVTEFRNEGSTELFVNVPKKASARSEEHTSELQSRQYLVCRLLLEKKKITSPSFIS